MIPLERAGLLRAFRNGGEMERTWAKELYELSMKAAGEESHVGITGNPQAMKIAEVVHGVQQLAKQRLNREGAWVGDYAGYITGTQHDSNKIRKAGLTLGAALSSRGCPPRRSMVSRTARAGCARPGTRWSLVFT